MNPFRDADYRFVSRLREELEARQRYGTITAEQVQAILARSRTILRAMGRHAGGKAS